MEELPGLTPADLLEIHNQQMEAQNSSAFDEDSFAQVLLIQVTRLYDVGLALLSVVDSEKSRLMAEGHARGEIFSPAPAFIEEEETQ